MTAHICVCEECRTAQSEKQCNYYNTNEVVELKVIARNSDYNNAFFKLKYMDFITTDKSR